MTREQIDQILADCESWLEPKNEQARDVFVTAMRARQYGYVALENAWDWFLCGWRAVS